MTRRAGTRNKVHSLYKCRSCRRQFSVTVGTIFEGSKVPIRKWFAAIYPMCAFKRGAGAQQIQIQIGVTYKTAWFMFNRIREAMGLTVGAAGGADVTLGDGMAGASDAGELESGRE